MTFIPGVFILSMVGCGEVFSEFVFRLHLHYGSRFEEINILYYILN